MLFTWMLASLGWRENTSYRPMFKVCVNRKFATIFTSVLWCTSERNRILNEENRGHGLFFYCELIGCSKLDVLFKNEHLRVGGAWLRMSQSFSDLDERLWRKTHFLCGLTCMDELFTTKIAMCANKINIVHFDFTWTLISDGKTFTCSHFLPIILLCTWFACVNTQGWCV